MLKHQSQQWSLKLALQHQLDKVLIVPARFAPLVNRSKSEPEWLKWLDQQGTELEQLGFMLTDGKVCHGWR